MYHYSGINTKMFAKSTSPLSMDNGYVCTRETAFDPLNYEFDAETMVAPFTYFHDGPAESRRKPPIFSTFPSPPPSLLNYPWSPTSSISPSDENLQGYYHQYNNMVQIKPPQQQQQQPTQYSKTICRHCKSHNMPECLYTSHSMYDESGEIFCPVLKKCHCANCIRVINSTTRHDDDSDDDNNHLRYNLYPNQLRQNSYPMTNNNNF